MTRFTRFIPALAAAAILAASAVPASAAAVAKSSFDGQWSVLIVTQKGTCDRAYRYPVKISNGSVGYAGDASFNVSGKVGDNGTVTVTGLPRQPERTRPGPPVGDRRVRHVDRRLGRLLGHLDGRAPLLCNPQNQLRNFRTPAPGAGVSLWRIGFAGRFHAVPGPLGMKTRAPFLYYDTADGDTKPRPRDTDETNPTSGRNRRGLILTPTKFKTPWSLR